jgi:hypothetical protein
VRAKEFLLENTVDEAKMNPSSFANAIKEGGDKGVLVGFEFEVCIPKKTLNMVPKEEKKYDEIIAEAFKSEISLYDWYYTSNGPYYSISITPRKFDILFKVKPGMGKFNTFSDLLRSMSKDEKEENETYGDLMKLMFDKHPEAIEEKFFKYFDVEDPKKVYKFLAGTEQFNLDNQDEYDYWDNHNPNYDKAATVLKPAVEQAMNAEVEVFHEYHESSKNTTSWYIEPDGSLEPNSGDAAAEIVSPPLPADQAMNALKSFYAMAKQLKLYTSADNSTGLHINVSIPGTLDVLKLAVFLGEQYVLKYFGREDNEYVKSVIQTLQGYTPSQVYKQTANRSKKNKKVQHQINYKALQKIINKETGDHFASISSNGKYISFRHAGGNYLSDYSSIVNIVGRFVQAMIIASDPEMYKQEYLKKLVKLFGAPVTQPTGIKAVRTTIDQIKQNGIPVIQIAMMYPKKRTATNWDNLEQNIIYGHTRSYKVNQYFNVGGEEIQKNSQQAKNMILEKLRGNARQEVSKLGVENFALSIIYPNLDTLPQLYQFFKEGGELIYTTFGSTITGDKYPAALSEDSLPYNDPIVQQYVRKLIAQSKSTVDETVSTGQGGGSAGNNGGQMVGGPTTYEQEYNKFKRKGPRRIIAMTYEDQGAETITLTDLYKQEKPDDNEQIWDYGTMIWDTPFEIKKITPRELDFNLAHQYDVEGIEDLFDRMEPEQHDIVNAYIKDPNLSNYIIVLDNGHIVDGNHRAIAAVLTKKPLRYIDIGEEG